MENKTLLSKNIEAQAKFLSDTRQAIQTVLQSIINERVSLTIEKKTNYRKEEWWELINTSHNWKENCGAISACFKNVVLRTWYILWDDTIEACVLQFNFDYETKGCGSNSLELCRLRVYHDGFIERID